MHLLSWIEQSGNFIMQLQDHKAGIVQSRPDWPTARSFALPGACKMLVGIIAQKVTEHFSLSGGFEANSALRPIEAPDHRLSKGHNATTFSLPYWLR